MWFESATKGILPYKMSAAGENFAISEGVFTLQNERRRRKFYTSRTLVKGFYLTKMSAAGENNALSERR